MEDPEAARRLGEAWCSDGAGFADVTIATARLQRSLRMLAEAPRSRRPMGRAEASVLVAVIEGEYHTLGAMVLTEQMRRRGVSVRLLLGEGDATILDTVADGHFDAIFLSVAVAEKLAHVRDLVEKTRRVAQHGVPVVVGGAIGQFGPDIKTVTGADHVATDAREALRLCGLTISHHGADQRLTTG